MAREPAQDIRDRAVAEIPAWYRPWMHLAATTGIGAGGVVIAIVAAHDVLPLEWLTIPVTFLFANAFEWLVHKHFLHKRRPPFGELFDRHTPIHHAVYTESSMAMQGAREMRLVLIPAVGVLGAILSAAPLAWMCSHFISRNVGLLVMAVAAGYMLTYELLHLAYHLPASNAVARIGIVKTLARQHAAHHRPDRMQKWNFNVTIPLCDWIMRTSVSDPDIAPRAEPPPRPSVRPAPQNEE